MFFRRKLHILFVLYYDFSTSSAIHVHNFANALAKKGHRCGVAVPVNKKSVTQYISGDIHYQIFEFHEVLNHPVFTRQFGHIDIIHGWTPRELVRVHCLELKKRFIDSHVIVHLEDNEEIVVETFSGLSYKDLLKMSDKEVSEKLPDVLSYPGRYEKFLLAADGVTYITDQLKDFIPGTQRSHRLWPIIDINRFSPTAGSAATREKIGLDPDDFVLCYIGSVHGVNAQEVRYLYEAVMLANRQGLPVKLIRTGRDTVDFLGEQVEELKENVIELGYVEMEDVPALMASADLLVQPGLADRFNRYRLPSKIPEFLATGKVVAVPRTNIGLSLKDNDNAIVLENADTQTIVQVISRVIGDPASAEKIGARGRKFAKKHFNTRSITKQLVSFYRHCMVP